MERTDLEGSVIDLSEDNAAADGADDIEAMRHRMAELERELEMAREDVGRLQLQVELFTSTDPITGFVNRTGTLEAIQSGLDRIERTHEPFTVLAIDPPGLDTSSGETIRHVGGLIGGGLRRLDRVGRIEEGVFVTVLANLDAGHLQVVTNRIRAALSVEYGTDAVPTAAIVVTEPVTLTSDDLLTQALDLLASSGERRPTVVL